MNVLRAAAATLLVAVTVLAGGRTAQAADAAVEARQVAVQTYQVRIETAMRVYDEGTSEYRQRAGTALDSLAGPMDALLKDLAARDATAGAAAMAHWREMSGALRGSRDHGPGILASGYDARVYADFDDNSQQLMVILDKAYKLGEGAPEQRAWLLAARVVANYILMSASPFGSYTASFNTEDSDLDAMVLRLDKALAELARKHAANPEQAQRIKKLTTKWSFIRTTILKAASQSTPYIVYKHGGDIIRELQAFN